MDANKVAHKVYEKLTNYRYILERDMGMETYFYKVATACRISKPEHGIIKIRRKTEDEIRQEAEKNKHYRIEPKQVDSNLILNSMQKTFKNSLTTRNEETIIVPDKLEN